MVFFSRAEGLVLGVCSALLMLSCPALAQSGPTVHSPEALIDCKGIENGANRTDSYGDCCLPSEKIYCGACNDHRSYCEKQTGVCGTSKTSDRNGTCCDSHPSPCDDCGRTSITECEAKLNACNVTPDIDGACCLESQKGCGYCGGCKKDCPTYRCSQTKGSYWPMYHNHGTGCPDGHEGSLYGMGPLNFKHGDSFMRVTLSANSTSPQKCYGRDTPSSCADVGKSGWIYSTKLAGELITDAEAGTAVSCHCNDGTISCP